MKPEQEKHHCSFEFEGHTYRGHIVSSTDILPHFHWFMFEDEQAVAKYGDSIAFKVVNHEIVPLHHLTAPELVRAVQECLRDYLATNK